MKRCPLLRSLSGVKRTSAIALHMSAFDPKDIRLFLFVFIVIVPSSS